jgi:hypothetical protein
MSSAFFHCFPAIRCSFFSSFLLCDSLFPIICSHPICFYWFVSWLI